VPGLLGPLHVPELWIQREWKRGKLCGREVSLSDGRSCRLIKPGRWNRSAGPDFLQAEMIIDGERKIGDVEIHWYREDWVRHGHDQDPGFNQVILHAVVLPSRHPEKPVFRADGEVLPEWTFGPFLDIGLESIAEENQLLESCGYLWEPLWENLMGDDLPARSRRIEDSAKLRWEEKVHFAGLRTLQLGLEPAQWMSLFSVLGYPRNRAVFMNLAEKYPRHLWLKGTVSVDDLWRRHGGEMTLHGIRPAHHPKKRLEEVIRWVEDSPDALSRLERVARNIDWDQLPQEAGGTRRWRRGMKKEVFPQGPEIPWSNAPLGSTIWNDVFLPFIQTLSKEDWFPVWFHSWPGNHPPPAASLLKDAGVVDNRQGRPLTNGWLQGIYRLRE